MSTPTRGLIIRKQYLDLILDGLKVWEMRSRPTKVRGPIALIEAGSGLIMGECELVDSLDELRRPVPSCTRHMHQVADLTLLEKWKYPWVLKGATRYDEPIPYDHPQGAVIWVNLEHTRRDA